MIYTTKELIALGENDYSIRKKVANESLFIIERGLYSTSKEEKRLDEVAMCKKVSAGILTGLSAFYIHHLTDVVPDKFYFATEQHSFPIRRNDVVQSYQDQSFFEIGMMYVQYNDNGNIRIYDYERTLIELFRLKEKYPRELYYEVLNSFRKKKHLIKFYRVAEYLTHFKNGKSLLEKIKESI